MKIDWKWILLVATVPVVGFGLFCGAIDWYENYRRTLPQRQEARRQAYLNQTVRGYATEQDVAQGSLRVTTVEYFGGYLHEVEYTQGKLVYRERPGMPGTASQEMLVEMTDQRKQCLLDIFNLIGKQRLWNQEDELPSSPVCDGGEVEYQFTVAGRQGRFKVVNVDPRHLEVFRYKCWKLIELCQPQER